MNTTRRSLMVLVAMIGMGANAQEPGSCQSTLTFADLTTAMGEGVTFQPVFARGGVQGFRLYGTRNSPQLTKAGVNPGALMTQVCGVPAGEIYAKGGQICCNVDASREIEVTIKFPDLDWKVVIKRP